MHAFFRWWFVFGFLGTGGVFIVCHRSMFLGPYRFFVGSGRRLSSLGEGFELCKVDSCGGKWPNSEELPESGSDGRGDHPGVFRDWVMFRSTASTSVRGIPARYRMRSRRRRPTAFGDDDASSADTRPCGGVGSTRGDEVGEGSMGLDFWVVARF
ncbi:hypothetical protein Rs2_51787 [Raphanus sativus]|nr:hypothetical protein Rs2_51787 [Raphanus sativus]